MDKPVLGLRPKHVVEHLRYVEIAEAIARFASAGFAVPVEWVEELHELSNRIRIRSGNSST